MSSRHFGVLHGVYVVLLFYWTTAFEDLPLNRSLLMYDTEYFLMMIDSIV